MSARAACRCRRCRKGSGLITGSYDIPAATLRACAVFTNTMPTQAYRSSGRPEVTFAIERLIDKAADAARLRPHRAAPQESGQAEGDAVPQRRRHALRQRHLRGEHGPAPWRSPTGTASTQRKREAKKRGKLLGLGLAQLRRVLDRLAEGAHRDHRAAGRPRRRGDRHAAERPGPRDELRAGGRRPARACRSRRVKIILGDTDIVSVGGGSHSGRSMRHAATVISKAAAELIAKGKQIAARRARRAARQRRRSRTAASASRDHQPQLRFPRARARRPRNHTLPDELKDGLAVVADNEMHEPVFPNGCAICEIEIDPDTGDVDDHALRLGRRRRPLHQSADRPRPDPWRHRAGRRPGDVGAVLRRSVDPASR